MRAAMLALRLEGLLKDSVKLSVEITLLLDELDALVLDMGKREHP
jgi:hypothetical protein